MTVTSELLDRFKGGPLRVFAYGSLLWNPGFPVEQTYRSSLLGFHRRFCVWSQDYRGSQDFPGLVLGLDRLGVCPGKVLQVPESSTQATLEYLMDRETDTSAYVPITLDIEIESKVRAPCLIFVANVLSEHYAGQIEWPRKIEIIKTATGRVGSNLAYAIETCKECKKEQISDKYLNRVLKNVTEV